MTGRKWARSSPPLAGGRPTLQGRARQSGESADRRRCWKHLAQVLASDIRTKPHTEMSLFSHEMEPDELLPRFLVVKWHAPVLPDADRIDQISPGEATAGRGM